MITALFLVSIVQSYWSISISLYWVSGWRWCRTSSSWFFDANFAVSSHIKLRDSEDVCIINISRLGWLSSGNLICLEVMILSSFFFHLYIYLLTGCLMTLKDASTIELCSSASLNTSTFFWLAPPLSNKTHIKLFPGFIASSPALLPHPCTSTESQQWAYCCWWT